MWSSTTLLGDCICVSDLVVWGDQTEDAFSNCGRMRVLYTVDLKYWLGTLMFRFKKPMVWFAFFWDIIYVFSPANFMTLCTKQQTQFKVICYEEESDSRLNLLLEVIYIAIKRRWSECRAMWDSQKDKTKRKQALIHLSVSYLMLLTWSLKKFSVGIFIDFFRWNILKLNQFVF